MWPLDLQVTRGQTSSEFEPCSIWHLVVRQHIPLNKNLFAAPPCEDKHRFKGTTVKPRCSRSSVFPYHPGTNYFITPAVKLSPVAFHSWFFFCLLSNAITHLAVSSLALNYDHRHLSNVVKSGSSLPQSGLGCFSSARYYLTPTICGFQNIHSIIMVLMVTDSTSPLV